MKKAILTFLAAFVLILTMLASPQRSHAETAEYSRLLSFLEEGKTWWYRSDVLDEKVTLYYSLKLQGDTIQDGKDWAKCYYQVDGKNAVPTPFVLLREEGKKVYATLPKKEYNFIYPELSNELSNQEYGSYYQDIIDMYHELYFIIRYHNGEIKNFWMNEERLNEILIEQGEFMLYDFNEETTEGIFPNVDYLLFSHWWKSAGQTVIENSGYSYSLKYYELIEELALKELEFPLEEEETNDMIVEGIGNLSEYHEGLFFSPYPYQSQYCGGSVYYTKPQCPGLLYVTDADNNILFEWRGGRKPWEPDGVESVNDEYLSLTVQNGVVRVNNNGDSVEITIYSADGSVVATATGTGNVEYPLTELQKGVYIVRAVAGNSAGKTIRVAI